jgi:hypothetical protein
MFAIVGSVAVGEFKGRSPGTAVEMAALWKPQNGFHSALEISQRTRDSHIPTADHLCLVQEDRKERKRQAREQRDDQAQQ